MSSFISNAFMLPNDLIDKGYMAQMKGAALPCYLFIVRKTRGWNKVSDTISLSQLIEGTGYKKDAVLTGLEQLISMQIIKRVSYANRPAKYTLTEKAVVGKTDSKDESTVGKTDSRVGKTDSTQSEITTHNNNSKTTITKANIYKEKFDFCKALVSQGADQKLVSEYMEVRKAKKAVNSETAFKSLISEQQKSGLTLNQVLEHCVVNSWKGFMAEWIKSSNQAKPNQQREQAWADYYAKRNQQQPNNIIDVIEVQHD